MCVSGLILMSMVDLMCVTYEIMLANKALKELSNPMAGMFLKTRQSHFCEAVSPFTSHHPTRSANSPTCHYSKSLLTLNNLKCQYSNLLLLVLVFVFLERFYF
jgi:hypothetical protein